MFLAGPVQALDRDLVVDARHHDVAIVGYRGAVHGQQVAVEYADLDHAVALHRQEIIRPGLEKGGRQVAVVFYMLLGQHRVPRRHPADDGYARALGQPYAP